jgi:hypothetical protein
MYVCRYIRDLFYCSDRIGGTLKENILEDNPNIWSSDKFPVKGLCGNYAHV